jgi:hypothetical protein
MCRQKNARERRAIVDGRLKVRTMALPDVFLDHDRPEPM